MGARQDHLSNVKDVSPYHGAQDEFYAGSLDLFSDMMNLNW